MNPRVVRAALLPIVLVLTFLVFLPSLHYDFVYDDYQLIVTNPRLTSWSYFPGYFSTHFWSQSTMWAAKYYRPLFLTWLRFNFAAFGLTASLWHLASILLHLGSVFAVFLLVRYLVKDARGAALAAAVFALHPVQAETVVWASSASDMLVAAFLALSVWFYARRSGTFSAWSIVFALLALYTKENGIAIAALIFAYQWTRTRFKDALIAVFPYALATLFYEACRMNALGTLTTRAKPTMSFGEMILTWPRVLADYAGHIVWPVRLSPCYDVTVEQAIWPLLLLIVFVAAAAWGARQASPAVRFGIAWFVITLLPALALRYLVLDEFVHDRYLYVPMAGLAIVLGDLFSRIKFRVPTAAAAALFVMLMAAGTFLNLPIWHDDLALFTRAHQAAPNNTLAITYLIDADLRANRQEDANRLIQDLMRLRPGMAHMGAAMGGGSMGGGGMGGAMGGAMGGGAMPGGMSPMQ